MFERRIPVAVVSDPYRTSGAGMWYTSKSQACAILVLYNRGTISSTLVKRGADFVVVSINDLRVASCYSPPSRSAAEFGLLLHELHDFIADSRCRTIIAGDFNAQSTSWSDRITNDRGGALEDWLDMASFWVVNDRGVPTFERPQDRSVIDLCLVPNDSSREFVRCSVDTINCSFSDYNYIYWDIAKPRSRESFTKCAVKGWSFDKIDKDKFKRSFSLSSAFDEAGQAVLSADQLDQDQSSKEGLLVDEIAALRSVSIRARRLYTRARGKRNPPEDLSDLRRSFVRSMRAVKAAINKSQQAAWNEFIGEIDRDPWGRPYIIVMKRVRA
ncbi:uncharacterized protein LOC112552431, partial [Pogonomyrmex barbatus]|uniref:Uncharacterized protein LOC112552431 n=1 Tax=Pogonomyrmex barbatus TaxID=144034 RepID=A0A8N1S5N5_9HYME